MSLCSTICHLPSAEIQQPHMCRLATKQVQWWQPRDRLRLSWMFQFPAPTDPSRFPWWRYSVGGWLILDHTSSLPLWRWDCTKELGKKKNNCKQQEETSSDRKSLLCDMTARFFSFFVTWSKDLRHHLKMISYDVRHTIRWRPMVRLRRYSTVEGESTTDRHTDKNIDFLLTLTVIEDIVNKILCWRWRASQWLLLLLSRNQGTTRQWWHDHPNTTTINRQHLAGSWFIAYEWRFINIWK